MSHADLTSYTASGFTLTIITSIYISLPVHILSLPLSLSLRVCVGISNNRLSSERTATRRRRKIWEQSVNACVICIRTSKETMKKKKNTRERMGLCMDEERPFHDYLFPTALHKEIGRRFVLLAERERWEMETTFLQRIERSAPMDTRFVAINFPSNDLTSKLMPADECM